MFLPSPTPPYLTREVRRLYEMQSLHSVVSGRLPKAEEGRAEPSKSGQAILRIRFV